jgi:hypothetical protein
MPASSTWLRRLSFLALLLILLLSSFAAPALAQTNITVANPSFETPVIPNTIEVENGYTMASAHLPTYWTISDYAGIGLAEYFNKDAAGHGQIAPAGTQVGYVQSYLGNGSYMQQTLTGLQSGQSYYITVAAAQRSTNTGSLLMPVQVSLGAQTYQFTPSSSQYQDYTFGPFIGSAGGQTLRFAAVTQSSSVDAVVMFDNVRVVSASGAFVAAPSVPIPNFSFEAPNNLQRR